MVSLISSTFRSQIQAKRIMSKYARSASTIGLQLHPYADEPSVTIAAKWVTPDKPSSDGRYIVLLHGALGCMSLFTDFISALVDKTELPVLTFDRQGHGLSSRVASGSSNTNHSNPANVSPIRYPRDINYLHTISFKEVPAIIESAQHQLGLEDTLPIIYGHSDGGSIALLYASRYPCESIVTEAPHVFVEGNLKFPAMDKAKAGFAKQDSRFRSGLMRHHKENTDDIFSAWVDTWMAPFFRSWNIEDCLPQITCPTLVIQGLDDEYGTKAQVDAITSQLGGPAGSVLIPEVQHHPHNESREIVVESTANFIEQWSRSNIDVFRFHPHNESREIVVESKDNFIDGS